MDMIAKSLKKIWLFCLWISSLIIAGCFHIPDEDWLPSKNKPEIQQKDDQEVEQAVNSFIDWFGMISTQRNEIKNNEDTEVIIEESETISETTEEVANIEPGDEINYESDENLVDEESISEEIITQE